MAVYTAIVLLVTLLSWIYEKDNSKYKKFIFILMVAVPSVISGIRGVGTDYYLYKMRFDSIAYGTEVMASGTDLKTPFYETMRIFTRIGLSYQLYIFIISFITIGCAFYVIRENRDKIDVTAAVFSYMTMFYLLSFNIFRQILSAELFALGIFLIAERKRKLTGAFVLAVSAMIHSSIIIYILIYLLFGRDSNRFFKSENKNKRLIVYLLIICIIICLPNLNNLSNLIRHLLPHYAYYFLQFQYRKIGIGIFRYLLLAWLVCFVLSRRKEENEPEIVMYMFMSLIGTILTWLSYVSESYIYRIGYSGIVFLPIVHGYFIKKMHRDKEKKAVGDLLSVLVYLLLFFFLWYDYIYLNTGEVTPYHLYFQ